MNTREIALRTLLEIQEKGEKSHVALQHVWTQNPGLSDTDRRFILRLVQGTLETQLCLDHRINQKSKVPTKKMKPVIREILRMGAYQLFYMDRVPASAVCNEAVKLTARFRFKGLTGFVNGVLRAMAREQHWPEEPLFISASIPSWILEKWNREQGEEAARRMVQALSEPKMLCFRLLPGTISEKEMQDSLAQAHVTVRPAAFPEGAYIMEHVERLEDLDVFKKGYIQIQDTSSMLVGTFADIRPGMRILDVCAAPGGKSLYAAAMLGGTGEVIACDITEKKRELIEENRQRLHITNLRSVVQDARKFVPEWENSMDIVLADLPCSGLGVMGRKPELRYRVSSKEIDELAALQKEILHNVWRYVKPGGVLLYSTCTVAVEENMQNRQWILDHLPLDPVSLLPVLPAYLASEKMAEDGHLQLLPGIHPCDGFYIAKFRKHTDADVFGGDVMPHGKED